MGHSYSHSFSNHTCINYNVLFSPGLTNQFPFSHSTPMNGWIFLFIKELFYFCFCVCMYLCGCVLCECVHGYPWRPEEVTAFRVQYIVSGVIKALGTIPWSDSRVVSAPNHWDNFLFPMKLWYLNSGIVKKWRKARETTSLSFPADPACVINHEIVAIFDEYGETQIP